VCAGLVALIGFGGCATARHSLPAPVAPASAAIVDGQEGKDRVVIAEAAKIEALAPAAKPHTDAQRAAVAAAPAADVSRLVAEFKDGIEKRDAAIAKLTADLAEAKNATDRTIRLGGYALAALLAAAAAASLFLAAQVPFLGPRISAALGAASVSVFVLLQAYEWTKAHPWATGITGLCLLIACVLAYANHLHHKENV